MSNDMTLDWQCIPITKENEQEGHCDYAFTAALYVRDPERRGRHKIQRHERGVLRIAKATGDIELIQPMPGDDNGRRAQSAARVVHRHWERGEYPQHTLFACG